MDEKTVKAAESILAKGDRVELIPIKGGVKVVRVRREEVKLPDCLSCKTWNQCISAAQEGRLIRCISFGYVQKHIQTK